MTFSGDKILLSFAHSNPPITAAEITNHNIFKSYRLNPVVKSNCKQFGKLRKENCTDRINSCFFKGNENNSISNETFIGSPPIPNKLEKNPSIKPQLKYQITCVN